jgi:hypothetical protein
MADSLADIRFDCLRNAIYHSSRRAFFDFLNRCLSFVVVASGAAAVADFSTGVGLAPKTFAFIAAMSGLAQLVFDFSGRARTHEFLQRRFYELAAEISDAKNPNEEKLASWRAVLNRLYAEEPPPMRAVDAMAYNAAVDALDRDKKGRIKLEWYHTLFAQWWPFNKTAF